MQGALLLVLFQVSHVLEHKLTHQAQGNLQSLFDAAPEHATLVQLHPDGSPDMTQLEKAKAKGVAVGSNMLVRPGEQVLLLPTDGMHSSASPCTAPYKLDCASSQIDKHTTHRSCS